jgi:hypothetical protein
MSTLLKMPEQERDALAIRLVQEIDACESDRSGLLPRWNRNEQIYYADESATSLNVIDGLGNYGISIWRGKCDKAKGDLVAGIFGTSPVVQCIEEGPEGTNEGPLEKALTQIAGRAKVQRAYDKAAWVGFNTNIGWLRTRTLTGAEGQVVGIECDWFHPKNTIAYPTAFESLDQCRTVGHRFYLGPWDIEQKQAAGEYYKYATEIVAGDDPNQYDKLPGRFDKTHDSETTVDMSDGYVECFELITRVKIGKEWKRVIVTLARTSQKILSLQEYIYSRPWYDIVRLCETEKRIYTNDSVANSVQGLGLWLQDLANAVSAGAYTTAYPLVGIKGFSGPQQARKYTPGEVIPLSKDGDLIVAGIPFDAEKFSFMIQKIEGWFDATVGVSTNQTGEKMPDTTATEASIIASAGQQRMASYLDAAADAVEGIYGMLLEYLRVHFEDLAQVYGGDVAALDPTMLERSYRLEVSGRSGASNPQTLLAKIQMLMNFAGQPMSSLDYTKVETRAVDAMDLPFSTEGLEKDVLTEWRMMFEQLSEVGIDPIQFLNQALHAVGDQIEQAQQLAGVTQEPGMAGSEGIPADAAPDSFGGADGGVDGAPSGFPSGDSGAGPVPETL